MGLGGSNEIRYTKIMNAIHDKKYPEIYKVTKLQEGGFKKCTLNHSYELGIML